VQIDIQRRSWKGSLNIAILSLIEIETTNKQVAKTMKMYLSKQHIHKQLSIGSHRNYLSSLQSAIEMTVAHDIRIQCLVQLRQLFQIELRYALRNKSGIFQTSAADIEEMHSA
jgi:hypothetical protein